MRRLDGLGQDGLTLVELLIAMLVFGVVTGSAVSVFRSQSRAFANGVDRMTVLQNLRYAVNTLQGDLRTVGSNVPAIQPFFVYADQDVIAFNADYATNVADDPFAVFYDPDAPAGEVTALRAAQPITVPNSLFVYPTTDYLIGGVNSPAETIVFYFRPDSLTSRGDDYALFRVGNGGAPEMVARNLLHTAGQPFFQFIRLVSTGTGTTAIQVLPSLQLPLAHIAPRQGSPADTAESALLDSLRAVRVQFTATNGRTGVEEYRRAITRLIRLPNAGATTRPACGDDPILGSNFQVAAGGNPGDPIILTWTPAVDEIGGERDVVRYVIYRRDGATPDWGNPLLSIPSGEASYTYSDGDVIPGQVYWYALAAQDCTPALSGQVQAGPGIAQ